MSQFFFVATSILFLTSVSLLRCFDLWACRLITKF